MADSKVLKEQLKKVDKTVIEFSIPVLDRIKLECLSFLGDEEIASPHGKDIIIGKYKYSLGVKNCYHHLSVGRALYKLISLNPALGQMVDDKKLSVFLIGEEVARLAQFYKDAAYTKAKAEGYGFASLNFHRIPDTLVDVNLVIEAVAFIKPLEKPLTCIEIYSQDETTRVLRKELAVVEAEEKEKQKAKTSSSVSQVASQPVAAKPVRSDPKYDGLFGDADYEVDLAKWEQSLSSEAKASDDDVKSVGVTIEAEYEQPKVPDIEIDESDDVDFGEEEKE